jgi:hypothetical protein
MVARFIDKLHRLNKISIDNQMAGHPGASAMSIIEKTIALLGGLRPGDIRALPPIQRRRFADICRYWADQAEPRRDDPGAKVGVLRELRVRPRDEG